MRKTFVLIPVPAPSAPVSSKDPRLSAHKPVQGLKTLHPGLLRKCSLFSESLIISFLLYLL